MNSQLELFEKETNVTGDKAWTIAKKVCLGDMDYDDASKMVASIPTLDADMKYFNEQCGC